MTLEKKLLNILSSILVETNEQHTLEMAAQALRLNRQTQVHCTPDCDLWQSEEPPGAVVVVCDCGRQEVACPLCLTEGRVGCCLFCSEGVEPVMEPVKPEICYHIQCFDGSRKEWEDVRGVSAGQLDQTLSEIRTRRANQGLTFRAVRRTFTEEVIE